MRGYCEGCKPTHSAKARFDASRLSAAKRGYDRQWRKDREAYFRLHPYCVDPYRVHGYEKVNVVTRVAVWVAILVQATEWDHIEPHNGDPVKFKGPKQGLCKSCHSRKTATEDSAFAGPPGGG